MSNKRHFTIVEGKKEHGLFVSSTPSGAARKVVSKLSKGKKVTFYLREITQGSKKKVYGPYEGIKKKLDKPIKVGDRVYKYEPVVKKMSGGFMESRVFEQTHKIIIPNEDMLFKIEKESPSKLNKFLSKNEAKYSLTIMNQEGKIYNEMKKINLQELVNIINLSIKEHCRFKEMIKEESEKDSSWKNLYNALLCDKNKERNNRFATESIEFSNWLKENERRENIFSKLNEKNKQLKYGKPNGTIDYQTIKNNILQQININEKYGNKSVFNKFKSLF